MADLGEKLTSERVRNRTLRGVGAKLAGLDDVIGGKARRDLDDVQRCEIDTLCRKLAAGGLCC